MGYREAQPTEKVSSPASGEVEWIARSTRQLSPTSGKVTIQTMILAKTWFDARAKARIAFQTTDGLEIFRK